MAAPITCEGAPRDLGLDQGFACRAGIRDWAARNGASHSRRGVIRSLRPLASGPVLGAGFGREVLRHHPHMAERMDGIARGAGIGLAVLMKLLRPADDAPTASGPTACDAPALATLDADGGGSGLVRALPAHAAPGCRWLLRRSTPEIGFGSVEVTLPWLASAVAGVNEGGLAMAIVPEPGSEAGETFAPPAILLLQDCLQRFADVDSALGWCARRPAAAGVSLLVADERGDRAAVILGTDGCRFVRGADAGDQVIVCGGDSVSAAELRKRLEAGDRPATALRERPGVAGVVCLDAGARTLCLDLAGAEAVTVCASPLRRTPKPG